MKTFGVRLKGLRESKNMSQEELAKLLNLSQSSIAYYESDKKQPGQQTVIKIAKMFNVTTDYLFGISDEPTPPKTTDIDVYIYQAKDLGQAIIRIMELDHELGFDDVTLVELIKKAKEKYGMPDASYSEPAAHGPGYPGSGALDDDNQKGDSNE